MIETCCLATLNELNLLEETMSSKKKRSHSPDPETEQEKKKRKTAEEDLAKSDEPEGDHKSAEEELFAEVGDAKDEEKPAGAGKGKGPKIDLAVWAKNLEELPGTVQIICEAGDNESEPLLVFVVSKENITPEQLSWLESLRTEPRDSQTYTHAERKIAELLFGFKDIEERREAFESSFVDDPDCDNAELEMSKFTKPGAWFNPDDCHAFDPCSPPVGATDDDVEIAGSVRMYFLTKFWENFNDMVEPYLVGDDFSNVEVIF